ncbi:MAG: flagellar biosynthesis protein FlhF [Phycisphaerales bacterium]
MKLKTFNAQTMADALAAVRKELGPDAMILHTRSYRVGSWFGLGGKNMVEITASAGESSGRNAPKPRSRPAPRVERTETVSEHRAPSAASEHDDRSLVLGGESRAGKDVAKTKRDPAQVVVQRASSIVEPQPILTRKPVSTSASSSPPRVPTNGHSSPRESIATRLPKREGAVPVRLSDANQSPPNPSRSNGNDKLPGPEMNRTKGESTPVKAQPARATESPNEAELKAQIENLQQMMGQVLETTRRTSVAVGKVDPNAAESVNAGPLLDLTNKLVQNDAPMDAVDRIIGRVRDRLDATELADAVVVRQGVLREIEATIDTKGDSLLALSNSTTTGRPRVISLIGPTGVGKTTTVAKLAAACKLRHGKKVGLITSDTYRIAAVEQLRTYAGIIGLPIKVVMTPEEMSAAVASLSDMDVIIVDTAGRSQHDSKRLDELRAFIDAAAPDETHLVLSSTVGNTVLHRTAEKFKPLGPDRAILTKLDEAVCTGHIAGLTGRIGLPLSFVTVGQEVPDDIEPARADRLARVALDGPEVLFGGSDGRG